MDREDIEFWNGALKGVLAAEGELEDLEDSLAETSIEGFRVARKTIGDLRQKMERMHGRNLRDFLDRYQG